MADAYIHSLTDLWNDAGTDYHAIKMNVTNSASSAVSRLLTLQIGGADRFYVDKNGAVVAAGAIKLTANDGGALGASGTGWSDLFLASGGVINWNAGDVTITHSANALALAGASSGYSFDAAVLPSANDAAALGSASVSWSDAFFASGGVLNFNNGDVTITHAANALAFAGATTNGYSFADGPIKPASNDGSALGVSGTAWSDLFLASGAVIDFAAANVVLTHSSGVLTLGTGDFRITTAGTNSASAVTVGGTQTLTNKTLTTPAFSGTPTGLDASTTAKGISEFATAAEFRTGTDTGRSLVVDQVWAAASVIGLTDAATIAVDMSTFINANLSLSGGGTRVLGNPTNPKPGQSGFILIQQGAGGNAMTFAANWFFAGGVDPTLSTGAGALDILYYTVITSTLINANLVKAVA